nr:hypothetical protein [Tanacetum cinerariifolium]
MANQEQNPPQQEQPFVVAKQIGFNLEHIILNTNNEVDLLCPEHNNEDHFKCVSDFIYKCCLRKLFSRSPNMYKEYLAEFWYSAKAFENSKVSFSTPTGGIYGEVRLNTFRNAIAAHYLPHSSEYVAPPSIDIVRPCLKQLGMMKLFLPKRLSKRVFFLLGGAPKTSSKAESVSQGTKPKAKSEHKKLSTSKQPSMSSRAATKEDQQETGDPTSLGVTSEVRANPQLSSGCDALADSTAKSDPGLSAPSDLVPQQQGMYEETKNTSYDHLSAGTDSHVLADKTKFVSEGLETVLTQPTTRKWAISIARQVEEEEASSTIKLEDLAKLVLHVQPSFKDLDSPEDDPVIVVDDSDDSDEDEETEKDEVHHTPNAKTKDTSVPKSSSPRRGHIKKNKGKKAMSSKDAEKVSTENDSDDETTHVPRSMVESSKKKELRKFDFVTKSGEHIHLTEEHISAQKKIEKKAKAKAARHEEEIRKEELIDLLCPEEVNKYYNDKLQYDRYCNKMLNRKEKSRITNCDILTRKGPSTLKVYRNDNTSEIIPEFKASDLHLGEWREVVKAYPNKKAELEIDLNRPLSEQDPLDRLNDLANKKRKHTDDIHDFFRANKRLKSPVQYKDHPAGTVLIEPVLGLDDHARTFSSLLLAEIDKRNINTLKQMRVIEHLRQ